MFQWMQNISSSVLADLHETRDVRIQYAQDYSLGHEARAYQ